LAEGVENIKQLHIREPKDVAKGKVVAKDMIGARISPEYKWR
jgi:hypothetical protein